MHTVFALLYVVVVIHWLIFPYPSGLLHWHCGNLTIAPVPAKQPWWIWKNTSCEFIMNDCITTTKQSTTKPSAYFLGYTVGTCMWCRYLRLWLHCVCLSLWGLTPVLKQSTQVSFNIDTTNAATDSAVSNKCRWFMWIFYRSLETQLFFRKMGW